MDRAFIFDVFGTLVDWRTGVAQACASSFKQKGIEIDPYQFATEWRAQYQPSMERIRSGNRGYVPLDILHRENLDVVLEHHDLHHAFSNEEKDSLNTGWERLPAWPDVVAGLTKLKQHAFIAPCSNGSIAMMMRIARHNNIHWDCILGAEIAKTYKPEPEVYLAACKALGLAPSQVMMVAAHNNDLEAARQAQLQTGFIARSNEHGPAQTSDLEASSNWNFTGKNIISFDEII